MNEQVQDGLMGTGPMNNGTGTQLRYEFRLERYGTPYLFENVCVRHKRVMETVLWIRIRMFLGLQDPDPLVR
jgi:hypothetical protein